MRPGAKRELAVFAGFVATSFLYFGWPLLPHPGRELIGSGHDPLIFVWSFAWWPHAILSWTNPFVTHALLAPIGANLLWATSVPGLALAFAPLTLLLGPVASYNLAAILLPALGAWCAYRLCLHLTRSLWASLVGGYLFGFSSFVIGHQLQGHINLTAVFLLPLVALVVIRYVEGELQARGFAVRFGVLIALQFSISTEIALSATLVLLLTLVVSFAFVRNVRPRLRALGAPLAAGYALGAVLASPLVVYTLIGFRSQAFSGAETSSTDVANVIVPTQINAIAGGWFPAVSAHFDEVESGLFLGLPTLLIILLYATSVRRSAWARVLVVALCLVTLITLGTSLHLDGHKLAALPWALTRHVPALDNANGNRFAVYVALASAVIVALWTARARGRMAWLGVVLPVLAVAALVPTFWHSNFASTPQRVPFFADGLARSCIPTNETLAVFPFGVAGDSMLWQAEAGIRFRLAEGYLWPLVFGTKSPSSFDDDPTVYALNFIAYDSLPTMEALLVFAATHDVGRIVSVVGSGYPTAHQMEAFGSVEQIGGVLVAPACGKPPLTSKPLTASGRLLERHEQAHDAVAYCHPGNGGRFYILPVNVYPTALLAGATRAVYVPGTGLTCSAPPGYALRRYARIADGRLTNIYPVYMRRPDPVAIH